jgi:hypothetical protein
MMTAMMQAMMKIFLRLNGDRLEAANIEHNARESKHRNVETIRNLLF